MVDDDTNIVDEILWSSKRSVGALTDRLEQLQSGALSPEARTLADRFPDALPDSMAALSDPQWPELDDDENAILSNFEQHGELASPDVSSGQDCSCPMRIWTDRGMRFLLLSLRLNQLP